MKKINFSPEPVKLFVGMLSNDLSLFEHLEDELQNIFGSIDLKSPVWNWQHTGYYTKEMGTGLKRKFVFFQKLIYPDTIADIKLQTIKLEGQYLNEKGGRRINLDPGYIDSSKIVLVSTKNYSHRIYLGKGIYGEVTLTYAGNNYKIMPYTYPDFRTIHYHDIFKKARDIYKKSLH
jgi:hypothetical protein